MRGRGHAARKGHRGRRHRRRVGSRRGYGKGAGGQGLEGGDPRLNAATANHAKDIAPFIKCDVTSRNVDGALAGGAQGARASSASSSTAAASACQRISRPRQENHGSSRRPSSPSPGDPGQPIAPSYDGEIAHRHCYASNPFNYDASRGVMIWHLFGRGLMMADRRRSPTAAQLAGFSVDYTGPGARPLRRRIRVVPSCGLFLPDFAALEEARSRCAASVPLRPRRLGKP